MALEIERKFLVCSDFKKKVSSQSHIVQGYICLEKGKTVRVRLRDEEGYLTIKGPSSSDGTTRYEFEKKIDKTEALELLKLCGGKVIDKIRYLVPNGKHVFEVDEFFAENAGLIMAEIELDRNDEKYVKPSFIGEELTGDRRFYNSQLILHPFCEWKEEFSKEIQTEKLVYGNTL